MAAGGLLPLVLNSRKAASNRTPQTEPLRLTFELFPGRSLSIVKFSAPGVTRNPPQLIAAFQKAGIEAALLNTDMIVATLQLYVAANRALFAQANNSMKTRSLATELMYFLAASRNIAAALKTFGILPRSETIIAAVFDVSDEQIKSLSSIVEGTLDYNIVFDTLYVPDLVKKHYGITDAEMNANSLESLITTRIAVHDL